MEGIGAAVRRPRGIPAPAGGMSSGDAPPISLLVLQKEKRAVHGPKRKNATAGRSAQAQPSCRRRGWARGSLGYTLRRFSLPLAWWLMGLLQRADEDIGPYGNAESHSPAVGADAHIRPLVQTPTTARVARSEAERAEREAGQMRSCTPTNHRTRAAGIRHQACTAPRRARRTVPVNPQAPSHADPLHRSASKRLFLLHRARRVLFLGKTKKRMGGASPRGNGPPAGAAPVAAVQRQEKKTDRLSAVQTPPYARGWAF